MAPIFANPFLCFPFASIRKLRVWLTGHQADWEENEADTNCTNLHELIYCFQFAPIREIRVSSPRSSG